MIVLNDMMGRAEAEGAGELYLVVRLVRPVPAGALPGPELDGGVGGLAGQLGHIVGNAVFVGEEGLLKAPLPLVPKAEDHPCVHHRLAVEEAARQILVSKRSREAGEKARLSIKSKSLAGSVDIANRVQKFVDCRTKEVARRELYICLLYTSPSPRDRTRSRMPSSA